MESLHHVDWDDEPTCPTETRPRARVLVIEDDARMRGLVRRQLAGDGHSVFEAESGDDALDLIHRMHREGWPDADIDLYVIDVRLPGCSGLEVLRILREHGVAAPAVVITGALVARELVDVVAALDAYLLAKPFELDLLSEIAIRMLDRAPRV